MEETSGVREEMNGRSYAKLLMLVNDTMRFQIRQSRNPVKGSGDS